jgi:hypothetical protein
MKLVGVCQICGAPAMNTCFSCGKLVCRAHYDAAKGTCTSCDARKSAEESKLEGEDFGEYEDEF